MRILKAVIAAAVLGLGSSCAVFDPQPLPKPDTNEAQAIKSLREIVNEGYAGVTSLNRVIEQNVLAGVWTKSQAQEYLDFSKETRKKLDKARDVLKLQDVAAAKTQREIVDKVVLELHKKIAAAARKEGT